MEGKHFVGTSAHTELVTIRAGNCDVRTLEREARSAMLCDGVASAVPILNGVTIFAAIFVGGRCELIVVRILVAVQTIGKLNFIDSIFASGDMALGTVNLNVFAFQRVLRSVVLFHAEQ